MSSVLTLSPLEAASLRTGRATPRDGRSPLRPLAEADAGEHCVAPVTLLDLKSTSCRWPVNDGNPFLFCGERAREGGPYCARHAARAVGEGTRSERAAARELKRQADRETPIMSSVE